MNFIFSFEIFYFAVKLLYVLMVQEGWLEFKEFVISENFANGAGFLVGAGLYLTIYLWEPVDERHVRFSWSWWPTKLALSVLGIISWIVYPREELLVIGEMIIFAGAATVAYFLSKRF
ncbi:hypothetical protein H6790_00430 [Candidatus Nomurabacteria bacterium]|nr:hypothetical protein [Candidatus Nomurabacteria bacterium]